MDYYDGIAEGYDELHFEEQDKKLRLIRNKLLIDENDTLLDVGCGTGLSSSFPCKTTGVDPSQRLLEIAKKKGLECLSAKAEDLPFSDHSFDVVISITAAQNFDSIPQAIDEMKRVGKDRFAITILRKSGKSREFKEYLYTAFRRYTIEYVEEEKDDIYIITS